MKRRTWSKIITVVVYSTVAIYGYLLGDGTGITHGSIIGAVTVLGGFHLLVKFSPRTGW